MVFRLGVIGAGAHGTRYLRHARGDVPGMTAFVDNLLASEDLNQAYLQNHAEVEMQSNGRSQVMINFSLQIQEAF